jgi:hypothetical protein
MRCLYCGKELALLKRLRGGGDFCSDAHKQSYQEEYNRLALSRLLQAQKKGKQTGSSPAENAPPPPNASIALEEPVVEEAKLDNATVTASATPVREIAQAEVMPQAAIESSEEEETHPSTEPEPVGSAGFLLESPSMASGPDLAPCLEAWQELSPGPAMSEWQIQSASFGLASGNLLSLDLRPQASVHEQRAAPTDPAPQAFAGAPPDPPAASKAPARKTSNSNRFPAGSVIAIQIAPSASALAADQSLAQALGFQSTVLFGDSELLQLLSTAIDFPAEGADAVVLANSASKNSVLDLTPAKTKSDTPGGNSPRASLEALSRLHQELVEQEAARVEEKPPEPKEVPVEVVRVVSVMVAPPQTVPEEVTAAASATVEIAVEQPEPAAPKPQLASDLFELSIKTFPPAKAAPIGGEAFPSHNAPLLPHLKSLPLRPKIALAPDYVPPGKATVPAETKPAVPAVAPVPTAGRTQVPSKPAPVSKPAARLTQPKQPAPAVKPVQTAAKVAAPKAEAPKPVAKAVASQAAPVQEATPNAPPTDKQPASKPASVANQTKPSADEPKPAADQTKPQADQTKPPADQTKRAADPKKPAANQTKPAEQAKKDDQAKKDNVPSFGTAESANIPWLGSLKVKLGIAILLMVIACAYFLWGGKSRKTGGSNSAVSADGSGPSIIMGEGGWVEGWGGDPNGMHAGRQITIYRPSLKLSDYRFEFQGSIDTKSVGWVFRASDPENYYAMKLMTVSSGLSLKVALFKYLVANGRQTQVGRVPIDLTVHADTVFDVRLDVRGPQFTTFIQGQQVDSWTDDQLRVGGAGFLNEREERGKVKSVSIRYLSGTGK